jgi:hypothetical protein
MISILMMIEILSFLIQSGVIKIKILCCGDWHMNPRWSRVAVDVAKKEGADAIFQVSS